MKSMTKCFQLLVFSAVMAALVGCEWEGSGEGEGWSDRYNWVNFSGVYRGSGGGVLISDYSVSGGTAGSTNNVSSQTLGTCNGSAATFSGSLISGNIIPGSAIITVGGFVLADDGAGNLVSSTPGASGTINYGSGGWGVVFDVPPAAGTPITASYSYLGGGTIGAGGSGTTGKVIYSFTVHHEGNVLQFTDNNGRIYQGRFGSVQSTGNVDQDRYPNAVPNAGDMIIADFHAWGVSAAGYEVEMVGTFQAAVSIVNGTVVTLSQRTVTGTWIEKGGRTGDINGQSQSITTTVSIAP